MSSTKNKIYWVHILHDFVLSGEAAAVGPYGTTIYMVLHTLADRSTGHIKVGLTQIAQLSGCSRSEAHRAIGVLVARGHAEKIEQCEKRRGQYRLKHKFGDYSWLYSPYNEREVHKAIESNKPSSVNSITVNLQIVESGGCGIQINADSKTDVSPDLLNLVIKHLQSQDPMTRLKWSKRAVELGASPPVPCYVEAIPAWAEFVAHEVANEMR